jgi:TMEM175 potassium channel family protein
MEAFSDGVFAIAITLLVLEIGLPAGASEDLLRAIVDQWPAYLAYLVSFATIGAMWSVHVVITEFIDRATGTLLRLNLLLLMTVSFLPYPTRLLGEHIRQEKPERVAVTFYGLCLFPCAVLVSVLWRYVVGAGLVRRDAADEELQRLSQRLSPGWPGTSS